LGSTRTVRLGLTHQEEVEEVEVRERLAQHGKSEFALLSPTKLLANIRTSYAPIRPHSDLYFLYFLL
jgi:hypothetical protein